MSLDFKKFLLSISFLLCSLVLGSSCFTKINESITGLDLFDLNEALSKIPEKEWPEFLAGLGLEVPEAPHVLQRWGTHNSKLAYRSYVLKQALGQRIARHYEKAASDFLDSPQGRRILSKSKNAEALKKNMPQILLSLASSGEVPLKSANLCNISCQTKMGEKTYGQLRHAFELESFNWDHDRVSQWVEAISDLQDQRPDLWKAMHTRVQDAKMNQEIREFLEDRGFHRFSDQYRYSGHFIQAGIVPIRTDSQSTLGVGIREMFQTENALCCGTSCGNCPLGFPPVLKDAKRGLEERNKSHVRSFKSLLKEHSSVFSSEREVIQRSITETFDTLNSLRAEDFGIYSKQDESWLDEHFRRGVYQAEAEFLIAERELVLRHTNNSPALRSEVLSLLSNPMLYNFPGVESLRASIQRGN